MFNKPQLNFTEHTYVRLCELCSVNVIPSNGTLTKIIFFVSFKLNSSICGNIGK